MHHVAVRDHLVGGDDGLQVGRPRQRVADELGDGGVVALLAVQVQRAVLGQRQRQRALGGVAARGGLGQIDLDGVTMKMISNTSVMSTSGVTLMPEIIWGPLSSPLKLSAPPAIAQPFRAVSAGNDTSTAWAATSTRPRMRRILPWK